MIKLLINNKEIEYKGDPKCSLLDFLRNELDLIAAKDGCSGQGSCGACTVEIDGKPRLACKTKMEKLSGVSVITMEGIPDEVKEVFGRAFVDKGAVQCGFCTPGFIMRTKILLTEKPNASREEISKAISPNLCRCTGFVKIVDAVEEALRRSRGEEAETRQDGEGIGKSLNKYQAYETAIGERPFVDDLRFDGMLHSALRYCDHPKAKILSIDTSEAEKAEGVVKVFTAEDIPGNRMVGLIYQDWPMMLSVGDTSRYIGDVIAGVVADTEAHAREAVKRINIEYEVLEPVTDMHKALEDDAPQVHPDRNNMIDDCILNIGDADKQIVESAYKYSNVFETQRIEHAFLETEAAVAMPENNGIRLYTQGQGVYVDRRQVASVLGLEESSVRVTLVPNGGGFGGKEDMTVQGHVSLFAFLLQKTVKLNLSREESLRMHPKRHPVWMDMTLACDEKGIFTAMKLRAVGDTGAYASVGTKVLERVAGHATGGYFVPEIDLSAKTVYTNNVPCGAMRGFGANQVAFALEACIDELCKMGGFDRWQIRFDNALEDGLKTATGQTLDGGIGVKDTLLAIKDDFYKATYAGLACGIKNSGVGNGMADESEVSIEILSDGKVKVAHGWTEMGQGVQNMVIQTLHEETGIAADDIDVIIDTADELPTGMTTSSRATALVGNAVIDAAKALKVELGNHSLKELSGRKYMGKFVCDWTTKPGADVEKPVTHFAYGYATQMVRLSEDGEVDLIVAAHDAGRIMNPMFFEGQIEGALHMGLGYALTEDFPSKGGYPDSFLLKDCGIIRAKDMPEVKVIGVEAGDPVGPYGAKGIGEIGLVPTAAAVANAFTVFDGKRRTKLPLLKYEK